MHTFAVCLVYTVKPRGGYVWQRNVRADSAVEAAEFGERMLRAERPNVANVESCWLSETRH